MKVCRWEGEKRKCRGSNCQWKDGKKVLRDIRELKRTEGVGSLEIKNCALSSFSTTSDLTIFCHRPVELVYCGCCGRVEV